MVSSTQSPMQRGQQWIEQLLTLLRIESSVTTQEQEDSFWLTIDEKNLTPEQIEILTGPNGQVLDAIQYLLNTTLNIAQPTDVQASYTIELNQYRVRREEVLREMVAKAVETVQESGEAYEMKGLSSAERGRFITYSRTMRIWNPSVGDKNRTADWWCISAKRCKELNGDRPKHTH